MPGFLEQYTDANLPPPPLTSPDWGSQNPSVQETGAFLDYLIRGTTPQPIVGSDYRTAMDLIRAFGPDALDQTAPAWQRPASVETYPEDLKRAQWQEEAPWIKDTFDFLGQVGLRPDFNVLSQVGAIRYDDALGFAYIPQTDPSKPGYEPMGRIQLDRQMGLNPVVVAHETAHLGWSYLNERSKSQVLGYIQDTLLPSLSVELAEDMPTRFNYGEVLSDLLENDPGHAPTFLLELYLAYVMEPDKPTHLLPRYGQAVKNLPVDWEKLRMTVQQIMQPFSQTVESNVDRQG